MKSGFAAISLAASVVIAFAGYSPLAQADAPPTAIIGDHTGDFQADLLGVDVDGNLTLWESQPDRRLFPSAPWDDDLDWSDVTAIVQYDLNILGYTDVLVRRSNGGLYDFPSFGASDDGGLLGGYGSPVGRNWNGIDAIIPIAHANGDSQLIARNRTDMKLYLYDWVFTDNGDLVLAGRGAIGSGWGGMRQIFSVGNFCGDSNPDLIGVHQSGILYCYALDAKGRTAEAVRIGHGWNNFQTAFSPGDLDGDGRKDLVGIRNDGATYGYPNKGGKWGETYWMTNIDMAGMRAIG